MPIWMPNVYTRTLGGYDVGVLGSIGRYSLVAWTIA